MTEKRKSPIRHKVRKHQRNDNSVNSYIRGDGEKVKLANPTINSYASKLVQKAIELGLAEKVVVTGSDNRKYVGVKITNEGRRIASGCGSGIFDLTMEKMNEYEKKIMKNKKPKFKHYVVRYRTTWKSKRTNVDSTNCFVESKKDIVSNILEKSYGHIPKRKQPKIKIIKAELQTPLKPRLKAFLDIDNRTRSRMKRGYILDYVRILDIDLPPVRRQLRFSDNYKKMKITKGMPPAHLHLMPNGRYKIDDGVHRIHAAKKLGYDRVPILIKYGDMIR